MAICARYTASPVTTLLLLLLLCLMPSVEGRRPQLPSGSVTHRHANLTLTCPPVRLGSKAFMTCDGSDPSLGRIITWSRLKMNKRGRLVWRSVAFCDVDACSRTYMFTGTMSSSSSSVSSTISPRIKSVTQDGKRFQCSVTHTSLLERDDVNRMCTLRVYSLPDSIKCRMLAASVGGGRVRVDMSCAVTNAYPEMTLTLKERNNSNSVRSRSIVTRPEVMICRTTVHNRGPFLNQTCRVSFILDTEGRHDLYVVARPAFLKSHHRYPEIARIARLPSVTVGEQDASMSGNTSTTFVRYGTVPTLDSIDYRDELMSTVSHLTNNIRDELMSNVSELLTYLRDHDDADDNYSDHLKAIMSEYTALFSHEDLNNTLQSIMSELKVLRHRADTRLTRLLVILNSVDAHIDTLYHTLRKLSRTDSPTEPRWSSAAVTSAYHAYRAAGIILISIIGLTVNAHMYVL